MNEIAALPTLPVAELEREMLKLPQADCPVRHHFGPGVYMREVTLPADTYAVGHKVLVPHVNMMLKGAVAMVLPDGRSLELAAPQMFIGIPGRKVGYIRERVTWLNIFPTDETNLEALEGRFFEKSEAFSAAAALELETRRSPLLLGFDREDYADFVRETGKSEADLKALFVDNSDAIDFPRGRTYKVRVAKSPLSGRGLFATADIETGEEIAPARIGVKRTPAGRFTNHARDPNARMVRNGNQMILIATRPIKGARGGFDGDEITVNYRLSIGEARGMQ